MFRHPCWNNPSTVVYKSLMTSMQWKRPASVLWQNMFSGSSSTNNVNHVCKIKLTDTGVTYLELLIAPNWINIAINRFLYPLTIQAVPKSGFPEWNNSAAKQMLHKLRSINWAAERRGDHFDTVLTTAYIHCPHSRAKLIPVSHIARIVTFNSLWSKHEENPGSPFTVSLSKWVEMFVFTHNTG